MDKLYPKNLHKLLKILSPLTLTALILPATASNTSTGPAGIDAEKLHQPPYNLLGRKIAIGQVEIGRPARFGLDKKIEPTHGVTVAAVFQGNKPATSNIQLDSHAQNVAGVMIANSKTIKGVAPAARLYSTAAVTSRSPDRQFLECRSSQHIALQNSDDVRAINFSFGEPLELDPRPNAILDGNAPLTQCIDWSARVHNVLYVIAGNQGKGGIPIPTDNYNGVNVGLSSLYQGVFSKVDVANIPSSFPDYAQRLSGLEANVSPRRSISLLAPGRDIPLLNIDGSTTRNTGTSFAAPHVTATVALLQEFGDKQLRTKQQNWSIASRQHEVMKAVLLNSADKLKDSGDGLRLGMTRTVIDKENRDWLASDSYQDPSIPLHSQMGTGHLNAFRAYQQFSAGQWKPASPVPAKGWDYNTISASLSTSETSTTPNYQEYVIEKPLTAGSFVSITLAWDRLVELEDSNNNNLYDSGEVFKDRGLNNLDLYLMPVEENDPAKIIKASQSQVDSVEHIFFQVPKAGRYKIRVQFSQQLNEPTQPYALAWWTG